MLMFLLEKEGMFTAGSAETIFFGKSNLFLVLVFSYGLSTKGKQSRSGSTESA